MSVTIKHIKIFACVSHLVRCCFVCSFARREENNKKKLIFTCHPCKRRLRSTARSHMTASPAWKSRSFLQRSCRNMPKHLRSSDVDAWCFVFDEIWKRKKREKKSIFISSFFFMTATTDNTVID